MQDTITRTDHTEPVETVGNYAIYHAHDQNRAFFGTTDNSNAPLTPGFDTIQYYAGETLHDHSHFFYGRVPSHRHKDDTYYRIRVGDGTIDTDEATLTEWKTARENGHTVFKRTDEIDHYKEADRTVAEHNRREMERLKQDPTHIPGFLSDEARTDFYDPTDQQSETEGAMSTEGDNTDSDTDGDWEELTASDSTSLPEDAPDILHDMADRIPTEDIRSQDVDEHLPFADRHPDLAVLADRELDRQTVRYHVGKHLESLSPDGKSPFVRTLHALAVILTGIGIAVGCGLAAVRFFSGGVALWFGAALGIMSMQAAKGVLW